MADRGDADQRDRQPVAPAEKRGDGDHPDAERHEARVKVRLQRIRARERDAVPQRHHGRQRDGQPHRGIEPRADRHDARPDTGQRQQVRAEEERLGGRAGGAPDGGEHFVEDEELALRVDDDRVARKRGGVFRADDGRHVGRLVGDAVAVPRAVGRRKQDERDEAGEQAWDDLQKFGASSALGPYIAGTGTSFRRRYTLS